MASQESPWFHSHYTEIEFRNFKILGRALFFIVVLFSVVLLITLLFLCARWFFRLRLHIAATSAAHLARAPPSQPQGLDRSTINSFPTILHRSSTTKTVDESECCICLGVFQDGEKVKVLPKCHHCYHSVCVDKWLRVQSSCPICRSSLRADSAVLTRYISPTHL